MLKEVVFFKSTASDPLKNVVIDFVSVRRHAPPSWWPDQSPPANHQATYIGDAMDIDAPWVRYADQNGRNIGGYDATNNIAWVHGADTVGGSNGEYAYYYAGMALTQGRQPGESNVPYGAYCVRNDSSLYPNGIPTTGWGWDPQEFYTYASTSGNTIVDQDSIVDRSWVISARNINAGSSDSASFTLIKAGVQGDSKESGLVLLQQAIAAARAWEDAHPAILCGDCNNDAVIDVGDVVTLINYLYKGQAAPVAPDIRGDCNADGVIDVGDVVTLINYLYKGQAAPLCRGLW
jgi:hypothetical protein